MIAGYYLKPFTTIHWEYKKYYPNDLELWKNHRQDFPKIIINIEHTSIYKRKIEGLKKEQVITSNVKVTGDGLIFTEVPGFSEFNDDNLDALQQHINSFIGTMNLSGWFFQPIHESYIRPISEKDTNYSVSYKSSIDKFHPMDPDRDDDRRSTIKDPITGKESFRAFTNNYMTPDYFEGYYINGKTIATDLGLSSEIIILGLNAVNHFSRRNWNEALLIGWAFIESIIESIWKKKILDSTEGDQKKRLKDNRTYSASVKLEILFRHQIIDQELYNYLNQIRGYRNDLIHSGKGVFKPMIDGMFPYTNRLMLVLSSIDPGINRQGGNKPGTWMSGEFRSGFPVWTGTDKGKNKHYKT